MLRKPLILCAAMALAGCTHAGLPDARPDSMFIPTPAAEGRAPILPSGVAVLHEYPVCAFEQLGEARVTHHRVAITPSRVRALQQEAALVGADAIIVHPNLPVCKDGTHPPICKGRGEFVIATAIHYLDEPSTQEAAALEYEYKRGYDTIEIYNRDTANTRNHHRSQL